MNSEARELCGHEWNCCFIAFVAYRLSKADIDLSPSAVHIETLRCSHSYRKYCGTLSTYICSNQRDIMELDQGNCAA